MRSNFVRTLEMGVVAAAVALCLPSVARSVDFAELDRMARSLAAEAATQQAQSDRAGIPADATYVGSAVSVKNVPEYLTGISLRGDGVVLKKSDGSDFTIGADPSAVSGFMAGLAPGGRKSTKSAKSEIFAWSAIALVLINVASSFFRMVFNARRAFSRRSTTS